MTKNYELLDLFNNSKHRSIKWKKYFSVYEQLFEKYRNKKITFVEIGVLDGGSLEIWKKYFGKDSRIIGIDNNSNCKKFENENFEIFIGSQSDKNFWKDNKGANINSIRTKKLIKDSDLVVVKFGEKYKQWNAAFDAGYAAALNKSIIVIHNEDHQHALKEIDAVASAVASNTKQVVRILKYIIQGEL